MDINHKWQGDMRTPARITLAIYALAALVSVSLVCGAMLVAYGWAA